MSLESFSPQKFVFFGAGVSGKETIPGGARFFKASLQGSGGNGGNGGSAFGGGGGSSGGGSDGTFELTNEDWGKNIFYEPANVSGDKSFVSCNLELYGHVSVLCSSGNRGGHGDPTEGGVGGTPGGWGSGGDTNYQGSDGQPGESTLDTGTGGIGGLFGLKYDVETTQVSSLGVTRGGRGGNAPSDSGKLGKPGFVMIEFF